MMAPATFTAMRKAMRPLPRHSRQMSQRAAARLLGIGFRTLQRIEDGTYGNPIPTKYENMIRGYRDEV